MYEAVLRKVTATWFPKLWKYVQIYVSEIEKKAFHFFLLFTKKFICFCLFLFMFMFCVFEVML